MSFSIVNKSLCVYITCNTQDHNKDNTVRQQENAQNNKELIKDKESSNKKTR